jgi:sulfite reductase alpha subunit-like flavoprotein
LVLVAPPSAFARLHEILTAANCLQARAPALKVAPAPADAAAKVDRARFSAPVKAARQLLASGSSDRATTLVTLDLSASPFMQYSPGDHLVVYPENSPKVRAAHVSEQRLRWTSQTGLHISSVCCMSLCRDAVLATHATWRHARYTSCLHFSC